MTDYFLGVDVGSSKTHALITDDKGVILGFGRGGPGNHEIVGYSGLEQALQTSVYQALNEAGILIEQISGAGFGVSGYDWPSERNPMLKSIASLGLNCSLELVNDVDIGLIAGATQGWGVAIDAGTGNNVRGRSPDGQVAGITGCGNRFGELGGASELVGLALIAIAHDWSRRGPQTILTEKFREHVGASSSVDFLEGVALHRYDLSANMGLLVIQAATVGDKIAQEIVRVNSQDLGKSALGVIRQLEFQNSRFEIVLIGSMFKSGPLIFKPMEEIILSEAPYAQFVQLSCPPVAGGVLLGMAAAGLNPQTMRTKLMGNLGSGKDQIFQPSETA
jgi:N-acetylglucosamine kinase-like BadF-type ATPase